MGSAVEEGVQEQGDGTAARRRYSRQQILALRDSPKSRAWPQGLDVDDLSDLQESSFFDKAPSMDGPPIYLGPQRGPAGTRAPFGAAGAARRVPPAVTSPGPIHSRLIDEDERSYQRTGSGPVGFGPGSPTKPQAIQRNASGRYEDPARMDRWDSRKLGSAAAAATDDGGWQQRGGHAQHRWVGGA